MPLQFDEDECMFDNAINNFKMLCPERSNARLKRSNSRYEIGRPNMNEVYCAQKHELLWDVYKKKDLISMKFSDPEYSISSSKSELFDFCYVNYCN